MQSFPPSDTAFLLKGPAGNIDLLASPSPIDRSITAIICHPHPLFGGTMNNKVVSTIARAFRDLGINTVRFNFRGVGKSEGVHDEGRGETDDVLAIAAWIKSVRPQDTLWLAGFSFGGFVAASAATRLDVSQLLSIAPMVSRFHTAELPAITCPWLIIQGEADDVISPDEVYQWVDSLEPQPRLIRIPHAGHFFHGQLMELRRCIESALQGRGDVT